MFSGDWRRSRSCLREEKREKASSSVEAMVALFLEYLEVVWKPFKSGVTSYASEVWTQWRVPTSVVSGDICRVSKNNRSLAPS